MNLSSRLFKTAASPPKSRSCALTEPIQDLIDRVPLMRLVLARGVERERCVSDKNDKLPESIDLGKTGDLTPEFVMTLFLGWTPAAFW